MKVPLVESPPVVTTSDVAAASTSVGEATRSSMMLYSSGSPPSIVGSLFRAISRRAVLTSSVSSRMLVPSARPPMAMRNLSSLGIVPHTSAVTTTSPMPFSLNQLSCAAAATIRLASSP
jgi:hypothetical protein